MCGLFGFTNFTAPNLERARDALTRLSHRGPDQWNDYYDNSVYMGHRRLSILDTSENGRQPMLSDHGDIVLSANGEIYNYKALRQELQNSFHFHSNSDSEVLLHGYNAWGIETLLKKIEGMYAFSIYDKRSNCLFVARDRVGIKPLYYSAMNGQFAWASELKAITSFYGKSSLSIDNTALYDFLTYQYIPTPKTLYKNIFKLEPAHYLKINILSGVIESSQYWKLPTESSNDDALTASKRIKTLIESAVNQQMVSDVPVGFFLSGGIDSSTVVAMAARSKLPLRTYSIGFNEPTHDETIFAQSVAEHFKTEHKSKMLDVNRATELFYKIQDWYDEPFADPSCFPTFLVSDFAKREVSVVLTGDGGDEVFCGYNWYRDFERLQNRNKLHHQAAVMRRALDLFSTIPGFAGRFAKKLIRRYCLSELELVAACLGGLLKGEKTLYRKLWKIEDDYDDYWYFRKHYRPELDTYLRLQYLDFHTYLPDDILTKVDRVSMAVSLECRVPLLSTELIEYVFSLPTAVRLYMGELKGILKFALAEELPSEVTARRKKGFSIPVKQWTSIFTPGLTRQESILSKVFNLIPNH